MSDESSSTFVFAFGSYDVVEKRELLLHYHYKNGHDGTVIGSFTERYVLPVDIDMTNKTTRYILQQLHIIVGISYYKSLLGVVDIPYALTSAEAEYYNEVYDNGLGEYSYINKLTTPIRPFRASPGPQKRDALRLHTSGALLGIGGGKDSTVSAELLKTIDKATGLRTTVMDVATRDHHGQAGMVMDITGLPQLRVERYLDTSIISFTAEHNGMNGHIPLSAILAWVGLLIAQASNIAYVMMANESAASSGNVEWNGREVNHQWSKSFEFETLTQTFVHDYISPDLWYFSPIRAYSSLAVMEIFAKLGTPYYDVFTSCNMVLRIDPEARPNGRWCTQCAKCLSTWLLLSPWLTVPQLEHIFGRNLFDDMNLRPLLESLLGLQGHKPLDCVGTVEELRAVTRDILDRDETYSLLKGVDAGSIPGPSTQDLIAARGPTNTPPEISSIIDGVLAGQI